MKSIILFGSTTGNTETIAKSLEIELGEAKAVDVAAIDSGSDVNDCDLLILGVSTWGIGELQDDWMEKLDILSEIDYSNKKVAIFGLGDQEGYPDSFVSGMKPLYDKVLLSNGTVIGFTPTDGFNFDESEAVVDNSFLGLVIDEDCQSDLTDERISNWVNQLKKEI